MKRECDCCGEKFNGKEKLAEHLIAHMEEYTELHEMAERQFEDLK